MALTRRERAQRAAEVLAAVRPRWGQRGRDGTVELTLQDGRKRRRVSGRVAYIATSGAYLLLADDGEPDESIGEQSGPLHVPVDAVRAVGVPYHRRAGFRQVVPNPSRVPERKDLP